MKRWKSLSDSITINVYSDQDRYRQSDIIGVQMLVITLTVPERCVFLRIGPMYSEKSKSTHTSGEKRPKKWEKSDMTTVFDHKKSEKLKCCNAPTLFNHLASQNCAQHPFTTSPVNLSRHLAKLITELSTVITCQKWSHRVDPYLGLNKHMKIQYSVM